MIEFLCPAITAVSVSFASYHFHNRKLNEINPGIHAECRYMVYGGYLNSYNKISLYAGYQKGIQTKIGEFGASVGITTGYPKPIGGMLYYSPSSLPIRIYSIPGYCIGIAGRIEIKN